MTRAPYQFKLRFTDDELELIECALRYYAKNDAPVPIVKKQAMALADKVADADEIITPENEECSALLQQILAILKLADRRAALAIDVNGLGD
jgi:hypothetical protein